MPDATLAHLIMPTIGTGSVGWIRRVSAASGICAPVPDVTLMRLLMSGGMLPNREQERT